MAYLDTQQTAQNVNENSESANGHHVHFRSDLERIAQVMYTQNLTLAQINRTLSILRAIDLIILESNRELKQLGNDISEAIINSSPYPMVAIFSLNDSKDRFLNFQGWALSSQLKEKMANIDVSNLLTNLKLSLDSPWMSSRLRNLTVDFAKPSANTAVMAALNEDAKSALGILDKSLNIPSLYLTKLKARSDLTGLMVVGLDEPMPHLDDIELIERLSEPTGIAFYNRLLQEENQNVLEQLKQTNDKLKEIDEAKDEFISMASHQLRTPLTSMKGYVSMVLDGEAGQISDTQRGMLQQAFNSSQRMVYLISDLLNVSRLRTGKFIINNKVTDLPQVVDSEISQLKEVAADRQISLVYNEPTSFPLLMLDETKIRQVIMNFLDNALYYTKRGGRITVDLVASEKNVEYTVTDTGLGVPKSEQPQLFTKFYRASNAKKMRPDGTGLGLYMAKKIIAAQGGTILFSSVEGQGCTFGFLFPRQRMEVRPPQA